MGTAKAAAGSLIWAPRRKRDNAGAGVGQTKIWCESLRAYRVVQYVNYDDDPFFALFNNSKRGRGGKQWSYISRHPDLDRAMRACEKHAKAKG